MDSREVKYRDKDPSIRFSSPTLFYDNYCKICYTYAKIISLLSRGRISVRGMYTEDSEWIRRIVGPSEYILMPWFYSPRNRKIYGGRSMILPLLREMIIGLFKRGNNVFADLKPENCSAVLPCSGLKGFVYRTLTILLKSKTIDLKRENYPTT
ncbi:MAG: hypothetical protein QXJ51_02940 [Sulfolobales archaeon]